MNSSAFRMIDVGEKQPTHRRALAEGSIHMAAETLQKIRENQMPKGNVLAMAEVAGILAAKQTSDLLPLCHPLPLDAVRVWCEFKDSRTIRVCAEASATAKTGVEMEALSAVSAALLSIYDLTKGVDPALKISNIFLNVKEGGKSGRWVHPELSEPPELSELAPEQNFKKEAHAHSESLQGVRVAVLTISDSCSRGEAQDESGPLLASLLEKKGAQIVASRLVPDEKKEIQAAVLGFLSETKAQLVMTTGGTGLSPRDGTPEALQEIFTKRVPGISECLRAHGGHPLRYLSRSEAGLIDQTLVVALPGSPRAVSEGVAALEKILPHALQIARGGGHTRHSS